VKNTGFIWYSLNSWNYNFFFHANHKNCIWESQKPNYSLCIKIVEKENSLFRNRVTIYVLILNNRSIQLDLMEKAKRNFLIKLLSITIHSAATAAGAEYYRTIQKQTFVFTSNLNQCANMQHLCLLIGEPSKISYFFISCQEICKFRRRFINTQKKD